MAHFLFQRATQDSPVPDTFGFVYNIVAGVYGVFEPEVSVKSKLCNSIPPVNMLSQRMLVNLNKSSVWYVQG